MRAIGYIRVSTKVQAADGASLDGQRARIEAWAKYAGAESLTIFEDAGISGGTMRGRAGLSEALAACGPGVSLVVYSISRLGRSIRDLGDIAEKLKGCGAQLVSLTEAIDTSSATGTMVFQILCVLAAFERDLLSERTKMAMESLAARGIKFGSPNPRAGGEANRKRWAAKRAAGWTPKRVKAHD